MRRRALLTNVGIGASALTVGCTGLLRNSSESTATLGAASITNFDTKPHRFQLRIERDGEQIHHSAHELDETAGDEDEHYGRVDTEIVDCTWDEVAGSYVVAARLADGEWVEQSVNAKLDADTECAIAEVRYDDYMTDEFEFLIHSHCDPVIGIDEGCPFADPDK